MLNVSTIADCDSEFLRAEDVGEILGVDPQYIRSQAQADPRKLGFPVIVIGRRVHIPKQAFLYFCKYGYAMVSET